MSEYASVATEFNDGELLISALTDLGYSPENYIGNPRALVGYMGDARTQTADVIIRRAQIGGSSNDIGFRRNPNGTYEAVISDFDSTKHNQKWLNKVNVSYQERSVERTAKKMGVRQLTKRKLPNGDIEMVFLKA